MGDPSPSIETPPRNALAVLHGGGEMGALMRATDWAKTPLGPAADWPQSLRTSVSILLESRFPMYIAWGPDFVQLYNDGYRPILGSTKHPAAMGRGARETFAESWHIIGPMFEGVRQGTAVGSEDWMLPLDRHGYLEECYFTFSYSPIRDESGEVGGVNVTVSETTGRVLGERRIRTLRDLAASGGVAQPEDDAWKGAARALEGNPFDVPFALLYRSRPAGESPELVAASGWAKDPAGAARFDDEEWQAKWPLRATTQGDQVVRDLRARFGDLPGGPWPEAPEAATVLAIARPGTTEPYGFLVAGTSPRRAPDVDHGAFLHLVADQIAAAVGNARSYAEEKRRAEALEEIDRAKTAFFSNVSHELRTPLTLMLGPVEDALADTEHPLSPEQRERQELIRRNGLRLQKLVNTLLDFSRVESGRAQIAFVPTDLAAFTVDLASSFESAMASAGLALIIDCPPLPETIFVDPAMWEKIVSNLLSNAFKFTFQGEVRVALEWRGDHVELSVADTGTGIPQDEMPRIFDRFYRVQGARGRSFEGTGIGLALVHELVKLHGGRVDVTSELGAGATFRISLPTGSAHLPKDAVRAAARTLSPTGIGPHAFLAEVEQWNDPAPAKEVGPPAAPAAGPARILVVDDNSDMRGYLARLLSPHWAVETASDGARGLLAAQTHAPDVILSDVMMPGLDGLGLVRALRGDERTSTIPIMLLSARAGEEATIEGLESGADEYLVKPFSAKELCARVAALLDVSRLRREVLRLEQARADEASRLLEEAERATRSREQTLAIVSHDLRTPLGAISTAADVLVKALGSSEASARMRKPADVIRRAADRMSRMLADLLDLASIEAGTLSFELRPLSADELVDESRETFDTKARDKGLTLETAIAPELPSFLGDKGRLLQVLNNLVSNAIKFTSSGGVVRLKAEHGADARSVRFVVEDTGPGIAPEAQAHVFDRYWHAGEQNRDGHGLGLSIARGIAVAHGGQIGVTSQPGKGSTFWVSLPVESSVRTGARLGALAARAAPASKSDSFARGGGELGELTRAFDWSTTPLGAMTEWPQSLRTSVSTMLRSPYPITLFWGRDLVMLYNDAFRPIHGEKHPTTLGACAPVALAEAWDVLGPLVARTLETGEPLYVQNGLVMFARRPGGLKEESYFTWSYNPTIGEDGEIAGLFAIANETTRQVIGDRRLATLRELSLRTAFDRSVEALLGSLDDVLAKAGSDVPFALFYVVEGGTARLASCTGVARASVAAPESPTLDDSCPWPLERVARSGEDVLVEVASARLGALPGGPWPEPATKAFALHVPMGGATGPSGVLVAGLSPRLSLDDDYRRFLQLLARQLSASITSARAYEQETQRAEKLAELDRAKTDFFSNVSHELRTPLTLILGPVEDALAQPDRSLGGTSLELVRRNALRLYKMVNTLLDFARVEAGRAQATFVPTDLSLFTTSLTSHFQSAADAAGIQLVVDCKPLPDAVYVDPGMWEKIVLNLLSNALKYTHRGRISVVLERDGGTAVLSVEDTGVGIDDDELARIFERFYRVREAQGRSHEGTGIGLALTRELVELHGGIVSAKSKLGFGSTFTVRIPRGSEHLPAERVTRTPRARSSATGAAAFVEEAMRWSSASTADLAPAAAGEPAASSNGEVARAERRTARILLVDDNADLRAYAADLLDRASWTVETASNGREALERARLDPPDLILSDVMMPVMDGFALVRALRADERTRSVPIILLSARAGDEATVEGLDSGADDYLVKPFSARELLARVRSQLEMARVRAEVWRARGQVDELQHSLAARDEFIAVSSHELRTPLTALRLQVETLLLMTKEGAREVPRSKLESKLGAALRHVDRLTRLVEALLDASQIAMGGLQLAPVELDLAELTHAVVSRYADDALATGSRLQVDAVRVLGRWDPRRLDQVISGLLSNALKYAPGTTIVIEVAHDGPDAKLMVRDHGRGIPPEALRRVFERFERAVPTDSYGGFGVGLYVAREIVEAHGGAIEAIATGPSGGTTIVMRLPVARPDGVANVPGAVG